MISVESWGRIGIYPHNIMHLTAPDQALSIVKNNHPGIAYGMGKSYGYACLNPGQLLWNTRGLDHFIHFDADNGRLTCEAGVLLRDIQQLFLPRGWCLPVTPGTQLITVGGAIANDVHGKNHHGFGSFCDQVLRIQLARTDGSIIECSRHSSPDMFAATAGGVGLTGVIITAELQLRHSPNLWLETETIPYYGLEEFFYLSDSSETEWEHTVSWIDCLSGTAAKGLFMRGRPARDYDKATQPRRSRNIPITPPLSLVNRLSLKPFNLTYYQLQKLRPVQRHEYYEDFLYPLDHLTNWNSLYGPKGFYQYQSVVPRDSGMATTQAMLDAIASSGEGSFLAVLKTFGQRQSIGMLGFPRPGVTLALDFPNNGDATKKLFERLDSIVRDAGGRIYLAKDARMSREMFEAGYPLLNEFTRYRDPGISSALSRRLMGS